MHVWLIARTTVLLISKWHIFFLNNLCLQIEFRTNQQNDLPLCSDWHVSVVNNLSMLRLVSMVKHVSMLALMPLFGVLVRVVFCADACIWYYNRKDSTAWCVTGPTTSKDIKHSMLKGGTIGTELIISKKVEKDNRRIF